MQTPSNASVAESADVTMSQRKDVQDLTSRCLHELSELNQISIGQPSRLPMRLLAIQDAVGEIRRRVADLSRAAPPHSSEQTLAAKALSTIEAQFSDWQQRVPVTALKIDNGRSSQHRSPRVLTPSSTSSASARPQQRLSCIHHRGYCYDFSPAPVPNGLPYRLQLYA